LRNYGRVPGHPDNDLRKIEIVWQWYAWDLFPFELRGKIQEIIDLMEKLFRSHELGEIESSPATKLISKNHC
jgi:hypothetical protein